VPARTRNYPSRRRRGHSRQRPEGPPVKPRDAATLIVVRGKADDPQVLMGKRSRKAAFIPDAYVFPGGRHDPEDQAVTPATPLDAPIAKMAVRGNRARAEGLAMTAIRETFEETGLLLARPGAIGAVRDPTWRTFRDRAVAPDLARLRYVGRAITSPYSPIRFHARFFVARAEHFSGTLGGSGELSDLRWVGIREALESLPIVDVTEFMLGELARRLAAPDRHTRTPLYAYRLDRAFVRYD
jgi:8-oxo-dGTP pyrophosphatase MutT (NUDIX family)